MSVPPKLHDRGMPVKRLKNVFLAPFSTSYPREADYSVSWERMTHSFPRRRVRCLPQTARFSRAPRHVFQIQKPNGQLSPRVRAVGPERFGILAVDVAKKRSRLLVADFYGNILMPPVTVEYEHGPLDAAIAQVRRVVRQRNLGDLVGAIERTGEYHRPLQRAFLSGGFETRIVHPLTTKQYRLPADPGKKTDDTDLAAIVCATTQCFGLLEPTWPELYAAIWSTSRRS